MQSVSAGSGSTAPGDRELGHCDLSVGCFVSICRDRLADELLAFTACCPEIDIGVHEMPRGALLPALRAGDLSLAVLPGSEEPGTRSIELWQDRVMVAMSPTHRLAQQEMIRPAQLRDEPLLVSRQPLGSDLHRFLARRILPLGPTLNAAIIDLSLTRILTRVANGDGIRFLMAGARERNGKPFDQAVSALAAKGVEFRVCENTLTAHDVPVSQLLPEAKLVPSGVVEVARLQAKEGFAYLRP